MAIDDDLSLDEEESEGGKKKKKPKKEKNPKKEKKEKPPKKPKPPKKKKTAKKEKSAALDEDFDEITDVPVVIIPRIKAYSIIAMFAVFAIATTTIGFKYGSKYVDNMLAAAEVTDETMDDIVFQSAEISKYKSFDEYIKTPVTNDGGSQTVNITYTEQPNEETDESEQAQESAMPDDSSAQKALNGEAGASAQAPQRQTQPLANRSASSSARSRTTASGQQANPIAATQSSQQSRQPTAAPVNETQSNLNTPAQISSASQTFDNLYKQINGDVTSMKSIYNEANKNADELFNLSGEAKAAGDEELAKRMNDMSSAYSILADSINTSVTAIENGEVPDAELAEIMRESAKAMMDKALE